MRGHAVSHQMMAVFRLLLPYCCFTAALLLRYCCFTAGLLLLYCWFTTALLLVYCWFTAADMRGHAVSHQMMAVFRRVIICAFVPAAASVFVLLY